MIVIAVVEESWILATVYMPMQLHLRILSDGLICPDPNSAARGDVDNKWGPEEVLCGVASSVRTRILSNSSSIPAAAGAFPVTECSCSAVQITTNCIPA